MEQFNIPVYVQKTHFSDACRAISHNAVCMSYGVAIQIEINSDYANKTLDKGWLNKYSGLKKL